MIVAIAALLGIGSKAVDLPYSWRSVEIVGGGFVTGIITHPRAKDVVYARTDIGGAYRWDAKTGRWQCVQDWLTRPDWNLYGAESVALDPQNPNQVYIAAGNYTNLWGNLGAILRTSDGGKTWNRTDLPFKNGGNEDGRSMGERLVVDPNDGRVLYFGTRQHGLWRSMNYGVTWTQETMFPAFGSTTGKSIAWVLFDPIRRRSGASRNLIVGVAAPGASIYFANGGGMSWEKVPDQPVKFIPMQAKLVGKILYVVYSNGLGPNGITDGAVWKCNTWTREWTDITPERPQGENRFGYAGITVDPSHPGTLMVSTIDRWKLHDTVFRSTDDGAHWVSLADKAVRDSTKAPYLKWGKPEAEFGHWIGDVEIDPHNPNRAWYVTGATIWRTDDLLAADHGEATHWVPRAEGLEETATIDLVSPPLGAHVVTGLGDIGGFRHDDLTVSPKQGMFTNPLLGNTDDLDFAEARPNLFLRVGRGGGTQHGAISTDGALTWTPLVNDPPGSKGSGTAAISADGQTIVWIAEGAAAHFTRDQGRTWTRILEQTGGGRVISDRVDPNSFYIHRGANLFVSHDGGATFSAGATGLPLEAGKIVAVFGKKGHLLLPTPRGLYRSTDGGMTFARVESVEISEQVSVGKAAPGSYYPAIFLIGTVEGTISVFRSDDNAKTWHQINDVSSGLGTMNNIAGDPKVFGRVYVGTNGRGVFVADPRTH